MTSSQDGHFQSEGKNLSFFNDFVCVVRFNEISLFNRKVKTPLEFKIPCLFASVQARKAYKTNGFATNPDPKVGQSGPASETLPVRFAYDVCTFEAQIWFLNNLLESQNALLK